jgi:two-component system C4-dicarboxylate transport sensor histidine kinase DctB
VIRFEDNGGGMDEATLLKIFEPYFTTKEEGKGTGIGLYMSKMIIENSMHGRLDAATIPGGACFTVTLPLDDATPGG